jgi:hypothetical protein
MEKNENEIIELAEKRAKEYLMAEWPPINWKNNPHAEKQLELLTRQAIFGFRVSREANLKERVSIDQHLRAARIAISTPEDRERIIRESMPKLLPELKKRP